MSTGDSTTDLRQRRYRALADPTRRRLLRLLDDAPQPVDANTLARRVGLHPNTVRDHLGILEEARLVERSTERRDRPGRPKVLFRAARRDLRSPEAEGYRFLAEVLSGLVERLADDPAAAAEDAGRAWGRYLADRPQPFTTVTFPQAVDELMSLLTRLGFDPDQQPDAGRTVIRLHDCPFREVAQRRADVVCSVHLGLMRGVAEELGGVIDVTSLHPFVEASLCVAEVTAGGES